MNNNVNVKMYPIIQKNSHCEIFQFLQYRYRLNKHSFPRQQIFFCHLDTYFDHQVTIFKEHEEIYSFIFSLNLLFKLRIVQSIVIYWIIFY